MSEKYHLEYSEKQGFFHYSDDKSNYSPTYKSICKNLSYNQCCEFTQEMFEKYPETNTGKKPVPKFDTIKKEFGFFLIN